MRIEHPDRRSVAGFLVRDGGAVTTDMVPLISAAVGLGLAITGVAGIGLHRAGATISSGARVAVAADFDALTARAATGVADGPPRSGHAPIAGHGPDPAILGGTEDDEDTRSRGEGASRP
ncbi:hypothetical protein JQC91_11785 [Jannaschia sp. Os4]|uniref:hypothetical protein n=1 Tax=Jannaschia sp. Os4 TaxID=2807617 RepID=UPI0019398617|nr:hypothetical protein [Jannaschia sp. Os4]MBM2576979.1 hypothetical protein [Jannaschia sp. Os4]